MVRFQNSSLLEKDDEYQPLLFHSNGSDRGKPEPFPTGNKQQTQTSQGYYLTGHRHLPPSSPQEYLRASLDRLSLSGNPSGDKDPPVTGGH